MFSEDPQNHHDCDQDDPHDDHDQDIQQEFKVRREKGENQESFPIVSNLQREAAKICSKICTGVPRMRKILTFRIIGKNDKGGPYKENHHDPTLNLQGCPK